MAFNIKSVCTLSGIFKIVQIVIAFVAIGLLRAHSLSFGGLDEQLTGTIAIGSSILISTPLLIGYIFFDHSNYLLEALFCLTACTMNVAGGALAIQLYKDGNSSNEQVKAGLAMGSMMIINALLYLIDGLTGTIHSRK